MLSNEKTPPIAIMIEAGIVPPCVQLLSSPKYVFSSLFYLGMIYLFHFYIKSAEIVNSDSTCHGKEYYVFISTIVE